MARLWGDGFDMYASANDMVTRYLGATPNSFVSGSNTAFSLGQAVTFLFGGNLLTGLWETATNETTIYGSLRLKYLSTSPNNAAIFSLTLQDVAANQVTVQWIGDGSIVVRTGGTSGTALMTLPNAFLLNTWDSWQFKIVINATTGSVEIRKNALSTPVIDLTGVNTRGGSSNNTCDRFLFGISTAVTFVLDDLWFNSDNGASPTTWPGDVRCVTLPVASQSQAQFLPSPNNYFVQNSSATTTVSSTLTSDTVRAIHITANASGTLVSCSINLNASATGHVRMGLYDATGVGGGAGTLLATSAVITNPAAGVNTFSVTSGPDLSFGTGYWVALQSDVSLIALGSSGITVDSLVAAYSGGLPAAMTGFTFATVSGLNSMGINILPDNSFLVSEAIDDGDVTFVHSDQPGNEDIYGVTAMPVTPAAILGVSPFVCWKRSDTGPRTSALSVAANGSIDTIEVNNVTPSLSYIYTQKFMPLDPTGAGWTVTSINGMQIGVTVLS